MTNFRTWGATCTLVLPGDFLFQLKTRVYSKITSVRPLQGVSTVLKATYQFCAEAGLDRSPNPLLPLTICKPRLLLFFNHRSCAFAVKITHISLAEPRASEWVPACMFPQCSHTSRSIVVLSEAPLESRIGRIASRSPRGYQRHNYEKHQEFLPTNVGSSSCVIIGEPLKWPEQLVH